MSQEIRYVIRFCSNKVKKDHALFKLFVQEIKFLDLRI